MTQQSGTDRDGGPGTGGDEFPPGENRRWWARRGQGEEDREARPDWVNALIALGLGVALAAQNLLSPGVSWFLRLPALIAALLLGAQGLIALRVDPVPEPRDRVVDENPPHGASGVAAGTENPGTGLLLVGLAIWLGVGALAIPTAPLMLSILSLVAAFLLFTEGLQSSRRAGG
jgi:hypothetical protein